MKQKIHAIATALFFFKQCLQTYQRHSLHRQAVQQRLFRWRYFRSRRLGINCLFLFTPLAKMKNKDRHGDNDRKAKGFFRLKAEGERLRAAIGQFSKKQLTNILSLRPSAEADASLITLMQKAKSLRQKVVGQFSKKQLTWGLPQPASHKINTSRIAMTSKRKGKPIKLRPNIIMILILLTIVIFIAGQPGIAQQKALQIGDTVPEAVWNTPLQVINQTEGKSTIRLSDYKGKLILLDFWAIWCGSCIEAMPKMQRLQTAYPTELKILSVTKDPLERVAPFIRTNAVTKKLCLSILAGDSVLSGTFPHRMVPHLVWIGKEGKVLGITSSYEANAANIKALLETGKSSFQRQKIDDLNFDRQKPLFLKGNGGSPMPVYRSIITAYQAGLPSMSGQLSDSLSKRLFASNYPLFKLYSIAMGLPSYWSSKRIVLNDSSIQHYQIHNYRTEAPRKAFCYELLLPVGSPKDMKAMLLADLERTFNISARLEEQELSCLVLKAIGDTGHLFDEHQAAAETGKQSIRHRPMSYLIDYLDRQSDLPVLDETGIKGNIDMDFKGSTQLPEQLNQSLAVYGLKATVQARKMQVMVLYHQ